MFASWLVSVNDGEGGKRREIELVVGGGDEEEEEAESVSMKTSRRHVFEDIEVKDDRIELKGQSLERGEEAARVSICIPPKNALLLMRCRSDPMKMAALGNRFSCDAAAAAKNENEGIEEEEEEEDVVDGAEPCEGKDESFEQEAAVSGETNEEKEITNEVEYKLETEVDGEEIGVDELETSIEEMVEEKAEEELDIIVDEGEEALVVEEGRGDDEEEEVESNMSSFEALLDQESAENYEDCCPIQDEELLEEDTPVCHLSPSKESESEGRLQCNEAPPLFQESAQESSIELKDSVLLNEEDNLPRESTADEDAEEQEEQLATVPQSDYKQTQEFASKIEVQEKKAKEGPLLPECLLLMMCEPKLSMEVSKETWVCSTDFMRWLPERPRKAARAAKPGGDELVKRRLSIDSKPKPIVEKNELHQPPRSSCSLPAAAAAASMASMIEQKLVNAVAYEPFVLTRCKSEPMRSAAAKLMPESCFWKNAVRKLEPHRCATMGVGAAGVGF